MSFAHSYETTARLVRAATGQTPTADGLPAAYRTAITKLRPHPARPGITVSYEDGEWGRYLIFRNVFQDIFVGIRTSSDADRSAWSAHPADALGAVRELSPDLARMVDLLVTDIVVLSSERTGGGSASHIPGLVCMSPGPGWTTWDFAESLVHDALHLNLFVADMVYGLYTLPSAELTAERYRVLSAVKIGERRPLDKAFHAAAVAVPLMYMQHERGVSTLVDLYSASLRDAARGLAARREVFTPYGRMLVDELCDWARTLDFGRVVHAVSGTGSAGYVPVA